MNSPIQQIMSALIEEINANADPRWKGIRARLLRNHTDNGITLHLQGYIEDGRFYWVRQAIPITALSTPAQTLQDSLLKCVKHLDSFLDERCHCVPSDDGVTSITCNWHKACMPQKWN